MLDVIVQPVADVVAEMSTDPLGDVTLETVQDGGQQAQAKQKQRRTDQHTGLPAGNTLVDHLLDDTRHDQG